MSVHPDGRRVPRLAVPRPRRTPARPRGRREGGRGQGARVAKPKASRPGLGRGRGRIAGCGAGRRPAASAQVNTTEPTRSTYEDTVTLRIDHARGGFRLAAATRVPHSRSRRAAVGRVDVDLDQAGPVVAQGRLECGRQLAGRPGAEAQARPLAVGQHGHQPGVVPVLDLVVRAVVDLVLDRVAAVVDQDDDRPRPVPDHRRDLLRRELERAVADHRDHARRGSLKPSS